MRRRTAWKIISTKNYYESMANPQNGKECIVPKSQKLIHLLEQACSKVKHPEIYNEMVENIEDAFEDDKII